MEMQIHEYDRRDYYQYEDVVATYPLLKKGCRTKNDFLKKHDIDDSRIYYARLIRDVWQMQDTPKQRDKLFIRKRNISNLIKKTHDFIPEIINLDDEEMFHDADGNPVHVQVVGKRQYDACYFCVKDIMNVFNMKSLNKTILDEKRKSYKKDIHYKIFQLSTSLHFFRNVEKGKTQLYLTYQGLIHMASVSRNKMFYHTANGF